MSTIPKAILSEHFQERMRGRALVCAIFTTYTFDPGFFEQEVLPVFLDIPLSHAPAIRLVQLEDALKSLKESISVYFDQNGLPVDAKGGRLDIRRIAIRHQTGVFHPKVALLLVESREPDDEEKEQALLVATMSANLTQTGWWENVECCHVEEIAEGSTSRMRDDLISFLDRLERSAREKSADEHGALKLIRSFLRGIEQRSQRSLDGILHPHFYNGISSFTDFLREATGGGLRGMKLEVISPYMDQGEELKSFQELLDLVEPREARLFLPRKDSGEVACSEETFRSVRELGVEWGRLPAGILKRGKSEEARQRFVHAKVYRFFSLNPKREIIFIGSVNLTRPAHQRGGNFESGMLIERRVPQRPDWWLEPEQVRPRLTPPEVEEEEEKTISGTPLSLRFWWDKHKTEVFWDDPKASPPFKVQHQGITLFEHESLGPRTWQWLPDETAAELERVLLSTSLLRVQTADGQEGIVLVQEEGMFCRPSLLHDLSPADILRYWSLLTVEQRAAFIETHAQELDALAGALHVVSPVAKLTDEDSMFKRFAGIFHGFSSLEKSVRGSLQEGREIEAVYRLFGKKYDSLGSLIAKIITEFNQGKGDAVDQYVTLLCARQLVQEMSRESDFWEKHREDARELQESLRTIEPIRNRLVEQDPEKMPAFLSWFESWFLRRARPIEEDRP